MLHVSSEVKERVLELSSVPVALGGWLGEPYEEDGCIKFLVKPFREIGIDAEPTAESLRREKWKYQRVKGEPQFGDIAIFEGLLTERFHVAFMLDARRAIQSSSSTNGVGKIDISREPWLSALRGIYRRKNVS